MLNDNFQPKTEGGIKRLARQIKKSQNISHNEALNVAAKKAGFQNYKHAKNNLQGSTSNSKSYQLFLSVYWKLICRSLFLRLQQNTSFLSPTLFRTLDLP